MKPSSIRLLAAALLQLQLLLSASSVLAAGALSDAAQRHFDAGLLYIDDPSGAKWDEALKAFRAAYALSPTWKLMNNIGLCALNLERDGEAIEAYQLYLNNGGEKGLTAKERKQIENDVAMLSASLVTVTIDVEPRDALLVDERRTAQGKLVINEYPITGGRISVGIHPGVHQLAITAAGYGKFETTLVTQPATSHRLEVKLHEGRTEVTESPNLQESSAAVRQTSVTPAPSGSQMAPAARGERHLPTAFYLSLAGTGVFAVAATATGLVTASKASDFDDSRDRSERHRIANSGKTYSLMADIGIGAALLCAGATTYFYFAGREEHAAPSARNRATLNLLPLLQPQAAGVAVAGRY
ncbi:MAG TPA: hypothetical protein VIV60_14215 [Polyangiaceae bacterium]